MIIWDEGTAEMVRDEPGHLSFILDDRKLSGQFGLTRTGGHRWILVKGRDEQARAGSDIVAEAPARVRSGKTWQDLASERTRTPGADRRNRCTPGDPAEPPAPAAAEPDVWSVKGSRYSSASAGRSDQESRSATVWVGPSLSVEGRHDTEP